MGIARKRTSVCHILGAQIRATCPTQGVWSAWLSGLLTRKAGGRGGALESQAILEPLGASLLTW